MAEWQTVRFDETYPEKLDPEIVPLCDALNAAGFVTVASCCGHGGDWPRVWFEHSTDARIESLARFVLATELGDHRPDFSVFRKEIHLDGYVWSLDLHLNNVYRDTPAAKGLAEAERALARVTGLIGDWAESEKRTSPRMDPETDPCPYCGDGDRVPAKGYWRCPECDAEWNEDEDEDEDGPGTDHGRSLGEIVGGDYPREAQ